jgi:hypothetical protein
MPRRLAFFVLVALACGDEQLVEVVEQGGGARAGGGALAPTEAPREPDPLLAKARGAVEHGRLPRAIEDELLASDAPAHARARRILAAMRELAPAPAEEPTSAPTESPATEAAPIASPTMPAVTPGPSAPPSATAEPAAAPVRVRPTLQRMSLTKQGDGATLELVTGRGVLVGVVHQREQGIVRLVLEGVAANPKVLSSRPSITGARVTNVDAGPKAVRVTLALDDGWTYDGVKKTGTGARVRLRRT